VGTQQPGSGVETSRVMAALVGAGLLEQGSCCVPSGKNAGEHTHMLDCFKTAATSNNTLLLPGA
jgi:hypothetical protein